jgi:hypothetical protein
VEIGFQGPDPSTDLRGAGMLGLRNLHYFVTQSPNSEQVYKVATDRETWYFFSASGINFTGKIIDLIENNHLDEILYEYEGEILLFINNLYDVLYSNFNSYWVRKDIKDFMKFNTLLDEFMLKESKKYISKSLLEISNSKFF